MFTRTIAAVALLTLCVPVQAQCPGGVCRRPALQLQPAQPVRNVARVAVKAPVAIVQTTARVVTAPVRAVRQARSAAPCVAPPAQAPVVGYRGEGPLRRILKAPVRLIGRVTANVSERRQARIERRQSRRAARQARRFGCGG